MHVPLTLRATLLFLAWRTATLNAEVTFIQTIMTTAGCKHIDYEIFFINLDKAFFIYKYKLYKMLITEKFVRN